MSTSPRRPFGRVIVKTAAVALEVIAAPPAAASSAIDDSVPEFLRLDADKVAKPPTHLPFGRR